MPSRWGWVLAALSGFVTVLAGAFGSHGLEGRIAERLLAAFGTGVRYQAWHTLAILIVLVWRAQRPLRGQRLVLGLWGAGIVLFSGSLYALALSGITALGLITPFGGVSFLAGWIALAVVAWQAREKA
jgi:uncharacterized membrane protein YgdD (TMEM256/DUF423 family)